MAIDLCAYLCREFNILVDKIVSHKESHDLGYASNHGDPHAWLNRYGWTMNTFRDKVALEIGKASDLVPSVGSAVMPIGMVVVTYQGSDGVNIRSAPEIEDNIVRVAYQGEEFPVVEHVSGWYKLVDGNYVSDKVQYVAFHS